MKEEGRERERYYLSLTFNKNFALNDRIITRNNLTRLNVAIIHS